jgi:hypothetical protein
MYAIFSIMMEANVVNPIEVLARKECITLLTWLH